MKQFVTQESACWQTPTAAATSEPTTTLSLTGAEGPVWEGFGGCFNELSYLSLQQLSAQRQQEAYDLLFGKEEDGLRFDYCRLPIGASDYAESWYSHNETEGDYDMEHFSIDRDRRSLLPFLKEALRRNPDMQLFASPWSPPTWMKEPKAYNFGTLVWTPQNLKAYALYLLKFIQAYEREGIHIHQLHVQNEPMSTQKFPSCIWTGAEFAEFIGTYLGPLFAENLISTKIWLGTLNGPETDSRALYTRYNDYANLVLHDEKAYPYIEGVSYQWAGKYALQVTRQSFPEKKYLQSENECGDGNNTWDYANYIFEMIRHYISNGVCGYVYWNMVLPPHGKSTWGWEQNSMLTVEADALHFNYEYYVMKHFARFVKPGARAQELTGHFAGTSVCFQNPDGSLVLIVQNPFGKPMTTEFEGESLTFAPNSITTVLL